MAEFPGFVVPTEAEPWLKRAFDLLASAMKGRFALTIETQGGRRFRLAPRESGQDAFLDVQGMAGDGTSQNPGNGFVTLGSIPLGADVWHTIGQPGEPAFANSWVNYGSGYANARFRRDAWGYVHLEGVIKTGTLAATAFTLPAGFRPSANLHIVTSGTGAANAFVVVGADGTVTPLITNAFNSFCCVFRGEQ